MKLLIVGTTLSFALILAVAANANQVVMSKNVPATVSEKVQTRATSVPEVTLSVVQTGTSEKKLVLQSTELFVKNSDFPGVNSEKMLFSLIGNLERLENLQSIHVVGHSESGGSEQRNIHLSLLRARTIKAFLQGAYPDISVSAMGVGGREPAHPNTTTEGRRLNNRIELRAFIGKAGS